MEKCVHEIVEAHGRHSKEMNLQNRERNLHIRTRGKLLCTFVLSASRSSEMAVYTRYSA
jgi:hypothetical protein